MKVWFQLKNRQIEQWKRESKNKHIHVWTKAAIWSSMKKWFFPNKSTCKNQIIYMEIKVYFASLPHSYTDIIPRGL